jgi:hypothetical protein
MTISLNVYRLRELFTCSYSLENRYKCRGDRSQGDLLRHGLGDSAGEGWRDRDTQWYYSIGRHENIESSPKHIGQVLGFTLRPNAHGKGLYRAGHSQNAH